MVIAFLVENPVVVGSPRAQVEQSVQMTDILGKIVDFLKPEADKKNVSIHMRSPAPIPFLRADVQDMEKLFTNLISNAIKYNVEKGSITIETSLDANYVGIHIHDTGIGISRDDLPRIFDDFFRAENSKTAKISGTGLGLTIAKKIVDSHFGHIEVKSEPDKGSTFSVYLPYRT